MAKPPPAQPTAPPVAAARPGPGLGGLDLAALANQSMAETGRRIAGQGDLMASYLDQTLGMNDARNAAGAERDGRMKDFQRQQALLREELDRQRMGQDAALQRARIEAAASEGSADRGFRSSMAAEERAFELGQAATQRTRDALEEKMLALQVQQMEQEMGGRQDFGRYDVSADRAAALTPGRQNLLRNQTFTDRNTDEGNLGFLPGRQGNYGAETQVTYDDLIADTRGLVDQYGLESQNADPIQLRQGLLELARNRPQLASMLLYDIGYNPAAFLAE